MFLKQYPTRIYFDTDELSGKTREPVDVFVTIDLTQVESFLNDIDDITGEPMLGIRTKSGDDIAIYYPYEKFAEEMDDVQHSSIFLYYN